MFSPVEKATFSFYNAQGQEIQNKKNMKVMLNPADINVSVSRYKKYRNVVLKAGDEQTHNEDGNELSQKVEEYIEDYSTVSMMLHFDLVHKYESFLSGPLEAVTSMAAFGVESLLGAVGAGGLAEADTFHVEGGLFQDPFSISLNKEGLTCYPDLVRAAKDRTVVKFEWGDMKFQGRLSNFSSKIDYFSPWGAPLRAEVNLSIVPTKPADNNLLGVADGLSQLSTWQKVWSGITSNLRPTI